MTHLRKPLRRNVTANVPHGVNPNIVVTLYPNGLIGLREARRRREYCVNVGLIYQQAVLAAARAEAIERKKERKLKRGLYT